MLLARVAERLFWMARYLERAENTARLLGAYTHQILDLPPGAESDWRHLVTVIGGVHLFDSLYEESGERQVMHFMIAAREHRSSLISCLQAARENARTTLDRLPVEAWETLNKLYLYTRDHAQQGIGRRDRHPYLREVVARCQQIAGILTGTMSRGAAYDFLRLGCSLERGDMTSRIVDSAVALLMPRQTTPGPYDDLLWVNVLKSLSAYQMYRLHVRAGVRGDEAVNFLLKDLKFPRSLRHSVEEAHLCLLQLPHPELPLERIASLRRRIDTADLQAFDLTGLHRWIDELQLGLAEVNSAIADVWFRVGAIIRTAA